MVAVLIDTGNQAGRPLISEELYSAIHPGKPLMSTTQTLVGAAGTLKVLGRAAKAIAVEFTDDSKNIREYRVRPFVIRGLNLDLMLSFTDLQILDVNIQIGKSILQVPLPGLKKCLKVPLMSQPPRPSKVLTLKKEVIPPGCETVIPVIAPEGVPGTEVLVDSFFSQDMESDQPALIGCTVLDTVRPDHVCHVRFWNISEHSVDLGEGVEVGYSVPVPREANQEPKLVAQAQSKPETRKALLDRLWTDLKFGSEDSGLSREERIQITKLFAKYRKALCLDESECGLVEGVNIAIDTGESSPIKQKCRPLAPHLRVHLKAQLDKWIKQGIIVPSNGPWASPIVAVPKKNGQWRFCADYRKLNAITKRDSRPVANLEEKLATIRGDGSKPIRYFASLDLSEAYHSVPIQPEDQDKTALITPLGLYKYTRMSFGLAAAPAAFHAVVQLIEKAIDDLDPEVGARTLLYFDDALCTACDFEQLTHNVEVFLKAIQAVGMKINVTKCQFGTRNVKWLGHIISEKGIFPDQDRVKALANFPAPKNYRELATLHGGLSALRKFVRNFAHRTKNIRSLLRRKPGSNTKDPIKWTQECEQEKQDVIKTLTSAPQMGHPDFSPSAAPFCVTVDTSKHGIGCTLSQCQKVADESGKVQDQEVIIFYGSRRLTQGESRYSAYKMELAGLVTAVETLRFYLLGRPFIIRTDHKALAWLMKTSHERTPALCYRWQNLLSEMDFKIEYVPSGQIKLCDALSRRPYHDGDQGNLLIPLPKRDKLWDDEEIDIKVARSTTEDDLWLPVMSKRHGETPQKPSNQIGMVAMVSTRSQQDTQDSLKFEKVSKFATVPTRGQGAIGWDLYSAQDYKVLSNELTVLSTGIRITIPNGMYAKLVSPTGGSALIEVHNLTLDSTSKDEILVTITNKGKRQRQIRRGDKIAQLMIHEAAQIQCSQHDCDTNQNTANSPQATTPSSGEADLFPVQQPTTMVTQPSGCDTDQPPDHTHQATTLQDGDTGDESSPKSLHDQVNLEIQKGLPNLQHLADGFQPQQDHSFMEFVKKHQDQDEACKVVRHCYRLDSNQDISTNDYDWTKHLASLIELTQANPDQKERRLGKQTQITKTLLARMRQGHLTVPQQGLIRLGKNGPVLIPFDIQDIAIQAVHHASGTFHLGAERTHTVAKKHFYFPCMHEAIASYISGCDQCQRGKPIEAKCGPGLGQTSSNKLERLCVWSMDVIHMPPGRGGYDFVLTLLDCATGWIEAFPMRKQNAATITKLLQEHILPRYGESLIFTVDRGKPITANVLKQAIKEYGGHLYETTSYHSNSNPVERFHLILEQIIRCKLLDQGWKKEEWPKCLPEALYTMRCAPNSLSKESPFLRVFGKSPVTKVNVWFGQSDDLATIDQPVQPWAPGEESDEDPQVISEDDTHVTFEIEGNKVSYEKIRAPGMTPEDHPHLAQVFNVHDEAQLRQDEASLKRHIQNSEVYQKSKPKFYSPILHEICDWKAPFDSDSQFNRKLAIQWKGPFKVVKKGHQFTVDIVPLDPATGSILPGKPRQVYVGDLRPSTIIKASSRPSGSWKPPWVKEVTSKVPDDSESKSDQSSGSN